MTVAPNPRRDLVPDLLDSSEIKESGQGQGLGENTFVQYVNSRYPVTCNFSLAGAESVP
jgi:hypothetical protein